MSEQRSVSVSTQEDDLVQRSTKKVKTRGEVNLNHPPDCMEVIPVEERITPIQKCSYKESLLIGPGLEGDHEHESIMEDDEPNPEDKWYKDDDDGVNGEKPFNPCPEIPVSKEEFEEWCKPWKNALMIRRTTLIHLWKGPGWWLGTILLFRVGDRSSCQDIQKLEKSLPEFIDLAKQLVPRISVLGCELHVEYEDGAVAGSNPPVDSAAEHDDDQNRKSAAPQNQHINVPHGNGQNNPDFGPWMMVKRYSNKKKIQIGPKESQGNQRQITKNNDKDESPRRKDSGGSQFTVLHEKNSEEAQRSFDHGENGLKELEVNGLQQSQAQNDVAKTPV
ncbi:hypothetical protein AHAS_Ahas03G0197000 [Arachis hypogaea]